MANVNWIKIQCLWASSLLYTTSHQHQLELIYDDGPLSVNSYTKIVNIAATNQILQDFPVQWLM